MANSSLIKKMADDVDLDALFGKVSKEADAVLPPPDAAKMADDVPISEILPVETGFDTKLDMTLEEAEQAKRFYDNMSYEPSSAKFVKQGAPTPREVSDPEMPQLVRWYDEVDDLSAAPVKSEPRSSNFLPEAEEETHRAQDIQALLDNRRFSPDRIFSGQDLDNLWKFLGDDFLADAEGNPIIMFRTGSAIGENGFPRAFGGGREFSAHMGTRTAALHIRQGFNKADPSRINFGGPGKSVDVYYTNIKAPLEMPDLVMWDSENVFQYLVRSGTMSTVQKTELLRQAQPLREELIGVLRKTAEESMEDIPDPNTLTYPELIDELGALTDPKAPKLVEKYRAKVADLTKQYLEGQGYDAIMYRNSAEGDGSMSYLPFRPESIKSIKNVGTFNESSSHVLKSILGGAMVGGAAAVQEDNNNDI